MDFILRIKNRYYFNRRVPEEVRLYDPRKLVRVALKTDSREQARKKAFILNEQIESYWKELVIAGEPHQSSQFKKVVQIARQMGFAYQPMNQVASLPLERLLERILLLKDARPIQIEAALGGKPEPDITVSKALDIFWRLSKDKVLNKSAEQIRKWETPRKRAIRNFIEVVGDKSLKDITRDDILQFRDWWLGRLEKEGLNEDSANKNFIQLKAIFETVSENEKIGMDIPHLFKKLIFKTHYKQKRLPFTNEQIIALLESPRLQNLNDEGRLLLAVMAETGARPSELIGLQTEDIMLDCPIPHIVIKSRKNKALKNVHSERVIPLTGYALEALKNKPDGFPKYKNKPDHLSNAVNKFLRENSLMPSNQHTVYSLRHSFQDRILSVNAPDRVQAELMGHKFHRPKYGNGASLEQKRDWLNKICLKQNCE